MKVAVIRFPGSNCDQDAFHALRDDLGIETEYVWHESTSLAGFGGVFLPGGFSYGDYLRCGAIASRAPIMDDVRRFATEGRPVIGACNGFQVLCESGLLPGALMQNASQKFVCKQVWLQAVNTSSMWTEGVKKLLQIPIAHMEGRYTCDEDTLAQLEQQNQIAFRYVDATGKATPESNPNGSQNNIAGILSARGNVLGMMPHPERATRAMMGGTDGLEILNAFRKVLSAL